MDKDDEALLDRLIEIICGDKMMGAESEALNLKQDAMRYRWLRNAVRIQITTETQMFSIYGKDLDAVIDTASGTDAANGGEKK